MTAQAEQQQAEPSTEGTVEAGLSAVEQASVEKGKAGFSEPTGVNEPLPSGPQRPEWCPEKFFVDGKVNQEALARSYAELEKARSAAPAKEEPTPAAEEPKVGANGKIEKAAEPAAAEATPLATAMEKARTEFSEGQEVSDETVAALEAAGIPKEIFGIYLKGLEALAEKGLGEIHGYVEGKDNYDAMAKWAAEKLSDAELDTFNASLDDPAARENAVRGLYARYTAARPSEGKLITPAGTPSQAGDVYASRDELVADQRNPLYATDAKFRQGVVEKLTRSQAGGFTLVARPMFEREIASR